MKEIKAVIRPNKLPLVRDALFALPGFPGMTVTKVEGCSSPQRHIPGKVRIREELTDFSPKIRLEIVVADEFAEAIFQKIVDTAQTGHYGDGLVWMVEVEKAAFVFKTTPGGEGVG